MLAGSTGGDDEQVAVVRLLADGALDPRFRGAGVTLYGGPATDENGNAVAVQPDRRIVIGGGIGAASSSDRLVIRLLGDTRPPDTKITKRPKRNVDRGKKVRFRFKERHDVNATFECKLKKPRAASGRSESARRKPFRECTPPRRYKRLRKPGKYVFRVRAVDPAGNKDPKPAKRRFCIVR